MYKKGPRKMLLWVPFPSPSDVVPTEFCQSSHNTSLCMTFIVVGVSQEMTPIFIKGSRN